MRWAIVWWWWRKLGVENVAAHSKYVITTCTCNRNDANSDAWAKKKLLSGVSAKKNNARSKHIKKKTASHERQMPLDSRQALLSVRGKAITNSTTWPTLHFEVYIPPTSTECQQDGRKHHRMKYKYDNECIIRVPPNEAALTERIEATASLALEHGGWAGEERKDAGNGR